MEWNDIAIMIGVGVVLIGERALAAAAGGLR